MKERAHMCPAILLERWGKHICTHSFCCGREDAHMHLCAHVTLKFAKANSLYIDVSHPPWHPTPTLAPCRSARWSHRCLKQLKSNGWKQIPLQINSGFIKHPKPVMLDAVCAKPQNVHLRQPTSKLQIHWLDLTLLKLQPIQTCVSAHQRWNK